MPSRAAIAGVVLSGVVGAAVGLGGYTFVYAKGGSYLTNDPAACANCHIMSEHYEAWSRSSHHAVAVCNDCHTPPGFVGKYATKAENGFWHSLGFTTGRFPDPLRARPRSRAITEGRCRDCHASIAESIEHGVEREGRGSISCLGCHGSVGHMR